MPSPKYGYRPEPVEGTFMESSSLDIIAPVAKAPASPEPVVKSTVCSLCELAWDLHGDNPTTDDCIRLLKAEMQRMRIMTPYAQPIAIPSTPPWVQPQPQPYPSFKIWCGGNTSGGTYLAGTAGRVNDSNHQHPLTVNHSHSLLDVC